MTATYYQIMAKNSNNEVFECFTWVGCPSFGIQRAYYDAEKFGIKIVDAWAAEYKKYNN